MQEAVPAGVGAMAAILGLDADGRRGGLRGGGAGAGRRAGQFQRTRADRDRRPPRGRRARDRCRHGAGRQARRAAAGVRAVPQLADEAGGRAPRRAARRRAVRDAARFRCSTTSTSRRNPTPDAIRAALARQAASPVRWVETIQAFAARGVTHVVECGPGRVLTGHDQAHRPRSQGLRARRAAPTSTPTRRGARRAERREDVDGGHAISTDRSRSSPARRAASAARSRSALAAAGATVVGTATTDEGAATIARVSRARRATPGTGIRLDVTDGAAVDAALAAIEARFGADHDPRQQRRHHARQPAAADEGRRVGRDHGDQPQARVPAREGGAARDDEGAPRPHHPDRLGGRRERQPGPGQLRGGQGGAGRLHQVARAGSRQPQHHRQLRRAGLHRHRHDEGARRRAARRRCSAQIPLGRLGTPDDIAHAVPFSPRREAAYITGATLHVNGGMYMA